MRPLGVELEGFSAYRSRQELDLGGVEFFSLSGATGSGKSSLVDAMIFALYGRIPRLDRKQVAPVISAGADRARVAFTFEVRGETYVAARMAQRTKTGATTPEARLQRGEEVLASGAGDVTKAVEALLGLAFDDFTRTVVLPQGEFARFLTSDPADRQKLLKKLLRVDYSRVRDLAREREAVAKGRAEEALRHLEKLEVPEPETVEAVRERLALLEALHGDIAKAERELGEKESALETAEKAVESLIDARSRLEGLQAPADLDQLAERLRTAEEKRSKAEKALEKARRDLADAEMARTKLPSPETIAADRRLHNDLAQVVERLGKLGIDEARKVAEDAAQALRAAETDWEKAKADLAEAERSHAAHALRAVLVPGEPCPVCSQEVSEVPTAAEPAELENLRRAVEEAEERVSAARRFATGAREDLVRVEEQAKELGARREELRKGLEGRPSPADLEKLEGQVTAAEAAETSARERVASAEETYSQARSALEDLAETSASLTRNLMEARDTVSDQSPPLPTGDDPIVGWKEILSWRDAKRSELAKQENLATGEVEKAAKALESATATLLSRLQVAEVEASEPYAMGVATELERARSLLAKLTEALERQTELTEVAKTAADEARLTGELYNHLKSNRFERWLMVGAVNELVSGANQLLAQLSAGSYSLHSDADGRFSVVDHLNADELRPVTTLSGGETFLVSLALALSLAEKVSASGGAALEAIILDEGFGTLDDESLDTVASVLESLTAEGLMVGVITHVKELASRAPDRFEVTVGTAGAEVRRVS